MDPTARFLSGPRVDMRYGISAMTRWRWQRDPKLQFPAPILINGRKLWRISDLESWERSRISQGFAQAQGEEICSKREVSGARGENASS